MTTVEQTQQIEYATTSTEVRMHSLLNFTRIADGAVVASCTGDLLETGVTDYNTAWLTHYALVEADVRSTLCFADGTQNVYKAGEVVKTVPKRFAIITLDEANVPYEDLVAALMSQRMSATPPVVKEVYSSTSYAGVTWGKKQQKLLAKAPNITAEKELLLAKDREIAHPKYLGSIAAAN